MSKALMWFGVLVALWSLTLSGRKSAEYVLAVLGYTAVVCFITFKTGGGVKINMDEDYSLPKSGD